MDDKSSSYYEFGPFRLNVTERLLHRNDELVPLPAKIIDTLIALVEKQGHVVTKDELLQTLWPNIFVEEGSLTQNISLLRRALAAENGNGHQYIETIPKRGYRFIVPTPDEAAVSSQVTVERAARQTQLAPDRPQFTSDKDGLKTNHAKPESVWRRYHLTAFAGFAVVVGAVAFLWFQHHRKSDEEFVPKSIAVLPFETIGSSNEPNLLGLGVTNALIVDLSSLKRATVLPLSSVFQYTKREKDSIAIGRELGVDAVLDGIVQRENDRTRVTGLLIRTSDGMTLWSGKFDANHTDTFAVQEKISKELISALAPNIDGNDKRVVQKQPDNTVAYNSYLFGLYFWNKRTEKESVIKAATYLEQSIKEDPNLAVAHALLAECYFHVGISDWGILSRADALAYARSEVQRALELDANQADAYIVLAYLSLENRDFVTGEQHFRRALELDPNNAEAHLQYGTFLYTQARMAEANAELKRSQELAPVSYLNNHARAYVLFLYRDYDGVISATRKALEIQPNGVWARANLAQAYAMKGMFDQALKEVEEIRATDEALFLRTKVFVEGIAGRQNDARRTLEELKRSGYDQRFTPYQHAVLYAAIGDKNKALEWLAKAVENVGKTESKKFLAALFKLDPVFDGLRNDVRFIEYLHVLQV